MKRNSPWDRLGSSVHPACAKLGYPFMFARSLWTEKLNGGTELGGISPEGYGLRLQPNSAGGASAVIQRVHSVQPEAGKLIVVAARIRADHRDDTRFWFGAWNAQLDPLGTPPTDGAFFEQYTLVGSHPVRARTFAGGSGSPPTDKLFDTPNHVFYDVAIVVHGTLFVDFVWQQHIVVNGFANTLLSWGSARVSTDIPTVPLRPSVLVSYPGSATNGGLHVRGFVVREVTLRE